MNLLQSFGITFAICYVVIQIVDFLRSKKVVTTSISRKLTHICMYSCFDCWRIVSTFVSGNWNEIADLLCFWSAYAQFVHMFNNTICVGMGATYTLCWPLFPDLPNSRYYAALSMSMLLSTRLLRPNSSFPVHHCLYSYWLRSHHRSKDNSVFVPHGKP